MFVPRARWGSRPKLSSTGSVISPPPPAMESTRPAIRPVRNRRGSKRKADMAIVSGSGGGAGVVRRHFRYSVQIVKMKAFSVPCGQGWARKNKGHFLKVSLVFPEVFSEACNGALAI